MKAGVYLGGFLECGPWMDLPVMPGMSEQSRVCKCLRICGSPPTPWKPALNWQDLRRGPCMGKCLDNCSTQSSWALAVPTDLERIRWSWWWELVSQGALCSVRRAGPCTPGTLAASQFTIS